MIEIEPPPSFQAQVWKRLSAIDCSARVDKKQNLTYLSWAWAWGILMENYPASTYSFDDPFIFPDGTGEVWVEVTVREGENAWTQKMWLPMLNFKNAPVTNPNAAQINYTRMRVLTKCLAMFGLGHYIYAGEDLPTGADPVTHQQDGPATPARRSTGVRKIVMEETGGAPNVSAYLQPVSEALEADDKMGLEQLRGELLEMGDNAWIAVYDKLSPAKRGKADFLLGGKGHNR